MAYTLTPEVEKELRVFADIIQPAGPTLPAPGQALTGAQLLEKFGIAQDKQGKTLLAGQLYVAKSAPAVNHHRRLCEAYKRGGGAAVEQYLEPYKKSRVAAVA